MIARDLKIALETGVTLDVQHISTKEGVEYVRQARRHSDKIYAEVTGGKETMHTWGDLTVPPQERQVGTAMCPWMMRSQQRS